MDLGERMTEYMALEFRSIHQGEKDRDHTVVLNGVFCKSASHPQERIPVIPPNKVIE